MRGPRVGGDRVGGGPVPGAGASARGPGDPAGRLAVVKLRLRLPNKLPVARFTRSHPELVVSVDASQELPGDRLLSEIDVVPPGPGDYLGEVRRTPGVFDAARVPGSAAATRLTVVTRPPEYLRLASHYEALLRYPRVIQDGEMTVEVVARVPRLRALLRGLRRISRKVELMRFGPDRMRSCPSSLSIRQHALLHRALAAGYFDVPRRITLTRLSGVLSRSKSTLSRSLALIEKRLAEAHGD